MTDAIRKTMFLRLSVAFGLLTFLGGSAVAVGVVEPNAKPSAVHGESIQFSSQANPSFCIDVAAGATQGRPLLLWVCTQSASQRWVLTKNSDGSNLFVDSQGLCVDSAGRKAGDGIALKVVNCSFVKSQRFRATLAGQLQVSGTAKCISIPRAGAGIAVFLATCDGSSPLQRFKSSQ